MKKGSLKYQIINKLNELSRFGESKYKQKLENRARGETNLVRVEGVYSFSTFESYKKQANYFLQWLKEKEYRYKILEEIPRERVREWLEYNKERGLSAWTLRLQGSAMAKVMDCRTTDFNFRYPIRDRREIKRSRGAAERDNVSYENNRDLIDFLKATGLRKKEIQKISSNKVFERDGQLFVKVDNGKGGKEREVHVIKEHEERVREIAEKYKDEDRMFEKINSHIDVHGIRREYAAARYIEIQSERESNSNRLRKEVYCRRDGVVFERDILMQVSRDLGHNRVDVVARHYLG